MNPNLDLKSDLSKYSSHMRMLEMLSLVLFSILFLFLIWQCFMSDFFNLKLFLILVVISYVLADFVSGFVHWFADTWGSYQWPVIGNSLIRSFREHHVDPIAITRHDFIEANGATALVSLPLLIFCWKWGFTTSTTFLISTLIVWLCFFSLLSSQIHKWAHQKEAPSLVRILQKMRLILSPEHHALHHRRELDIHYCMTSGWLNPILNHVRFFRCLEKIIQMLTGSIPRSDDKKILGLAK